MHGGHSTLLIKEGHLAPLHTSIIAQFARTGTPSLAGKWLTVYPALPGGHLCLETVWSGH